MKILTSAQMKEIDRRTIEEIGIPGAVLMENAGIRIFQAIQARFPCLDREKVVIVAGKGNNGGDGMVVARHLFNLGCRSLVLLLAEKQEVGGDAAVNLKIAENIGVDITEIKSREEWKKHRETLFSATVLVDAVFGTGLMKPAEDVYSDVIQDINASEAFKIAVDIPSGLSSDTFEIIGPCVKADLTVCLAAPKIAHIFPPAEDCVGELVVADISIPPFLFDDENLQLELVERTSLRSCFRKRPKDSHKGTYGHLLIVSGSMGKTGAVRLAGKAALKSGAGLVTVATPASCLPIVARSMDELMTEPLPETPEKTVSSEALPEVLRLLEGKDALLVGPGLSSHPSTTEFLLSLLPKVRIPLVIDADGINILASGPALLKSLAAPAVLTPHPGEFARMLHVSIREVLEKRLELAAAFSTENRVYLVLKGYKTLIADPGGRVFVNPTGNPGMATGGTGDVLSGMIASLVMQEKDMLAAILAAVYVHGLSSDIAVRKVGERPLTAGDIIGYIPRAIKELESEAG